MAHAPPRALMQPAAQPRFYLPQLDGLRFIAFLLVFIHNANPILKGTFLEKFSEYSWFGVDLFFCLSGFLITKLLVMENDQTGTIDIRNFYVRRALRILPLYLFYILVGAILMAPIAGRNVNLPWQVASLATFTFNVAYLAFLPSPILIFTHLWSISYEGQFYAAIPWFARTLANTARPAKINYLVIFFLTGTAIRALFIHWKVYPAAIYFLPIAHFESLLGGIALGLGILAPLLTRIQTQTLWTTAVAFTFIIFVLPNNNVTGWGLMLTYLCVGASATSFLYLLTTRPHSSINKLIGNTLFASLGKISYGLYLFHFGCFTLAVSIVGWLLKIQPLAFPRHTPLVLVTALALTIVFASASYRLIEKPALRLKRKFSPVPSGSK